ncbi:hypothetical protein CLV56_4008 [Mumia flava]|uniref:HK97 family phage prohead protease n=1 Tax=Mumia flava TaxID=1348852 RepID=A0A0B2BNN3_9ACTN|nr:hypothetical protein [Mumia flava]PJJ48303.1 hypothetical protein CLV56_4008 [Mumia flava]
MPEPITFEATEGAVALSVEPETRMLRGVLLPFNVVSRPARDTRTGKTGRFRFSRETTSVPENPSDVVLNYGHDRDALPSQVGVGKAFTITDDGILADFKIARTPEGDRVLALSDPETPVLKNFSAEMGGDFTPPDAEGVQDSLSSLLVGAAVVLRPAFEGAHITSVAASAADNREEGVMPEEKTTEDPASVAFSADQGTALTERVDGLEKTLEGLKEFKAPVTATPGLTVVEEPIYRFAGSEPAPSGFDFAEDLLHAANGDLAALERVKTFTAEHLTDGPQFVDTGDTSNVNPATYRPDMFLGQAPVPTSPLFDTFRKGGLSSVQPFFWSKLDRASTDAGVADHTEGTDPADGDVVTAAGATVTPAPVSGKVHVTREVGDQGGNPNVSGLVWNEFTRSFSIALETKTAALITAALGSITALASPAAGAAGNVAGLAVEAGLVGLQFDPEGTRFTKMFGHVDLYSLLATYENGDGEKRYPIINPSNRDGVSGGKYSFLDIAGYRMEPAHSLGATGVNEASILADPGAVHVWNSGLSRLDKLNESVEGWDIGAWGYFAGIVYDVTGLRKVVYALS